MAKFELKAGHEIRGFKIRLYPDAETEEKLKIIEDDTRRAWNWLVKQTEEVLQARAAYALKNKLVPDRPVRPEYEGLPPEESKATKEAYINACIAWRRAVYDATNKLPECSFRKFKSYSTITATSTTTSCSPEWLTGGTFPRRAKKPSSARSSLGHIRSKR